jgi:hypothetical protein
VLRPLRIIPSPISLVHCVSHRTVKLLALVGSVASSLCYLLVDAFGGYDGRRNHNSLLLYSIRDQRWFRPHHLGSGGDQAAFLGDTTVLVTGNAPPGRNGHSATLAADPSDEENGRIIIIGGWLGTGPLAASDMHVLDISNGGLRLRWYQVRIM